MYKFILCDTTNGVGSEYLARQMTALLGWHQNVWYFTDWTRSTPACSYFQFGWDFIQLLCDLRYYCTLIFRW